MPLNHQTAGFLQQLAAAGAKRFYSMEVAEGRAAFDTLLTGLPPTFEKVARIIDRNVPGPRGEIAVRIYTPLGKGPFPMLAYFHGGGFVIGSLIGYDMVCRELCSRANAVVISVEYGLGPEDKFPAAPDDAYAATQWIATHAAKLGGDPDRLFVGGDSAGGNLAAVTAQRARDLKGPKIAGQLLIYPMTDAAGPPSKSMVENAEAPLLGLKDIEWFMNHYLASAEDAKNPACSPARAGSLADLPPALVLTAELDPLRDEGEDYANALKKAGNEVVLSRYDGAVHGTMCFVTVLDQGREMMDECTAWLRERAKR